MPEETNQLKPMLPGMYDAAQLPADVLEYCDVIVAGSGAGGAVLAKELAEGGLKVVIVEEGGFHSEHRDLPSEALGRLYRDAGVTATMGRPMVAVPMGKCFGGSTTINSGTCFRTPEPVLERWRKEFGLPGFEPDRVDRVFSRVEQEAHIQPADFAVMSRPNVMVHEFLAREGLRGAPIRRNAYKCEGCGTCCYGCTSGAKQAMNVSYLPKALKAGARAYVNAEVRRILTGPGSAAQGVVARAAVTGCKITLHAPIVVAACGSLLSPILLKRSGIARGNRHLGRHLTLHPASKVVAEFEQHIDSWEGIPQAYSFEGLHDDGIMMEGISMPPDLGAAAVPFVGPALAHYIKRYAHMASCGFMISDTTEGRLARLPFLGYKFLYSMSEVDARRMRRAIAFLARLFLKNGALRVYAMVSSRNNILTSMQEVDCFERTELPPGAIESMAFHPMGTCRMAASPALGVCDPYHQVFGAPGLYVCDGSVVPTPLGVNPQQTIMGLATRLAEHLLGKPLGPQPGEKGDASIPAT